MKNEGNYRFKILSRRTPRLACLYCLSWLHFLYRKAMGRRLKFSFNGRQYYYFHNRYNFTWADERTVEVPVVWDIVRAYRGRRILEVGNVLSHYFPVKHAIIDKYERVEGVTNEDAESFRGGKYDLIVSISTLEHVGWDERPKDAKKILRVIRNMRDHLSRDGKMVVTLPLGYNSYMDGLISSGRIGFSESRYLKRVSNGNDWVESDWEGVKDSEYNHPFPLANAIVVGVITNRSKLA